MPVKAKDTGRRPARRRQAGRFKQWLDLPLNALAKPGEVGGARGNQPPKTLNCCTLRKGLLSAPEDQREATPSVDPRGGPTRHFDSPAPPPCMDNPEEAGKEAAYAVA